MTMTVRSGTDAGARATGIGPAYIPALEGLRGLAILAVIVHHLGYLSGGFFGVDLFFSLSGFLITSVLLRAGQQPRARVSGDFWRARTKRLEPALLVVIAVVLLAAVSFEGRTRIASVGASATAALTYTANWYDIAARHAYTSPFPTQLPLGHLWSLAIEAQLYVAAFAIVLLAERHRRPEMAVRWAAGALAVGSWAAMVLSAHAGASDTFLYKSTATRAAPFAIGMVLATLPGRTGARAHRSAGGWIALGAAAGLSITVSLDDERLWSVSFPATWIAASVLTWCASRTRGSFSAALSVAPLRWLGRISYSTYLVYWPIVLYLDSSRTGVHGRALDVLQATVILSAGWVSFKLVERPGRLGRDMPVLRVCLVGWSVLVAASVVMAATAGGDAPARQSPPSRPDLPVVLVVGDSVAGDLAQDGLIPEAATEGLAVASVAADGCNPIAGAGEVLDPLGNPIEGAANDPTCIEAWPKALETADPDIVVVLFGGYASASLVIDGAPFDACDPAFRDALTARLARFRRDLTASGAEVALVTAPTPDATGSPYEEAQDEIARRFSCWNATLRAFAADHAADTSVVDLAAHLCPEGDTCRAMPDGSPMRADGLHLRGDAAKLAAGWLLPRIAATR